MVLVVEQNLRESVGDAGLEAEGGNGKGAREIGRGEAVDEGQLLDGGGAEDGDEIGEGMRDDALGVGIGAEEAGEEDTLHAENVAEGFEEAFIGERGGVGGDGGKEGGVGPSLMSEEGGEVHGKRIPRRRGSRS